MKSMSTVTDEVENGNDHLNEIDTCSTLHINHDINMPLYSNSVLQLS